MERKQYWSQDKMENCASLEFRAGIALTLIEHFGSIAADIRGEDSGGRAKLILQAPDELVNRCFAIADCFVARAEERGEIREPEPFEVRNAHIGNGKRIQMEAEFKRDKATA